MVLAKVAIGIVARQKPGRIMWLTTSPKPLEIAHTHNRQKIHFNGKLEDQHKSQPEDWHGHADERDDHDNVIEDRILL